MKIGRNDPCPCGSGKKYKQCCGRNQCKQYRKKIRGDYVVELDAFKATWNGYKEPLLEVRDSL